MRKTKNPIQTAGGINFTIIYGASFTLTRCLAAELQATCKLKLHAQAADNGISTRLSPVASLHKKTGTGGSEQRWLKLDAYTSGRRTYLQTASDTHSPVTAIQRQLGGKNVTVVPRHRVQNQSKQSARPLVHPQQQSSRTSNASSLLQCRSHRTHELCLGIHFDRMLTYKTKVESTKLRCK